MKPMIPHDPSQPVGLGVSYLLWLNPFIPAYHFYLDRPVHGPGRPGAQRQPPDPELSMWFPAKSWGYPKHAGGFV